MRLPRLTAFVGLAIAAAAATAQGQKPLVLPGAGQSVDRQLRDDAICMEQARASTGGARPGSAPAPARETRDATAPGVDRTVRDDPTRGRVIVDEDAQRSEAGNVTGMYAGREARQAAKVERRVANEAAAAQRERSASFYGVYGTCMEERGYKLR